MQAFWALHFCKYMFVRHGCCIHAVWTTDASIWTLPLYKFILDKQYYSVVTAVCVKILSLPSPVPYTDEGMDAVASMYCSVHTSYDAIT